MFAEWRAPIVSLKMGTTRIKFLGEEGEGGGDRYEVEIKPVGVGRRAEVSNISSSFLTSVHPSFVLIN